MLMKTLRFGLVLVVLFSTASSPVRALTTVYTATLTPEVLGATGTGSAQVDWDDVRRRTEGSPYARAFFTLVEELGVVEPTGTGIG